MRYVFLWMLTVAVLSACGETARAECPCGHDHDTVTMESYRAMLCNNCGFGSKKDNCVLCGKWISGSGVPARLCNNCGFGSRKDNCVLCGKWVGSNGIPARLCNNCGFGNRKDNCCKCGKWISGI